MATLTATEMLRIRSLIGDPDGDVVDDELVQSWWDYTAGDLFETAALLADGLCAKYSKSATFAVEGLRIENASKAENYRELAQRLRVTKGSVAGSIGVPFVGGVSISEMEGVEDDADRTPSRAAIGLHDIDGGENDLTDWRG